MANNNGATARGAVIQGSFIGGRVGLQVLTARPAAIQARMANAQSSPRVPVQLNTNHGVTGGGPVRSGPTPITQSRGANPNINQHAAHLQRMAQPKMAQPRVVHPQPMPPRIATPQAPVVQRSANGQAFQLPENLSRFGGGGGQPLPGPVLQKMESFFGASFADVRVHVGPQASAIGALAFTQGSNLYFAQGQYNPHTPQGQQILGHELAHVVQQRAGRVRNPFGSGVAIVQDRSMEAEADRMGVRAASHKQIVQPKTASSVRAIQPKKIASSSRFQNRPAVCQPKYRAKGRLKTRGWYTASGKYFIADNNTHKLYSSWRADPPQPASLYDKSWEWSSGLTWSMWTPKVQFLPNNKQMNVGEPHAEYKKAVAKHTQGSFIFGKNDCSNFATALSSLIGEEKGLAPSNMKLKGAVELIPNADAATVGTYMKHLFHGSQRCEYHAATVVAVDGKDLVTLEAHVSKPITTPEFHIRSGVYGFVRDNDPKFQYGDDVDLQQIGTQQIGNARNMASNLNNPEFANSVDGILERGLVAK